MLISSHFTDFVPAPASGNIPFNSLPKDKDKNNDDTSTTTDGTKISV